MPELSPRASRLATPHWLDARLAIGVVLVLLAVVAGARVFAGADRETPVYVARHALVPGEPVGAADLTVGRVRFDGEGGSYIAATGAPPAGYVAARAVAAGELVPLAALSRSGTEPTRLVTVPVAPGHLPADLGHGDLVDVYVTPRATTSSRVSAPVQVLAAVAVDSDNAGALSLAGGSTVSVVLVVPVAVVPAVVQAVEGGTIDVVGVPASALPLPVASPSVTATAATPSPSTSARDRR